MPKQNGRFTRNKKGVAKKANGNNGKLSDKRNNAGHNGVLTYNQQLFADEWLIHRNGTRAYKVAYPYIKNDASAAACASALLKVAKVDAYISKELQRLSATCQLNQEWVLNTYRKLTEYTLDDIYNPDGTMKPIDEMSENAKFAVCGVKMMKKEINKTTKEGKPHTSKTTLSDLKFTEKKLIVDKVGEHLGMFKKEGDSPGGNTFIGPTQIIVGWVDD